MSFTDPKTWTAAVLAAADMNTHIRDSVRWLAHHSGNPAPAAIIRNSANIALTSGAFTDLTFDTTIVDRGGFRDSTAQTLVAPVAGFYALAACVEVASSAGNKELRIRRNATPLVGQNIYGVGTAAVGRLNAFAFCWASAADVFYVSVFSDAPGTVNVTASGEMSPVLGGIWLGTAL